MRPWVLMRHFEIPFTEKLVRFDAFGINSTFKQTILPINPDGAVPILVDDDLIVTDSLAIAEYLAEQHPELHLWPKGRKARAKARSLVAKMHSGFSNIRHYFTMNIEADLPEIGQLVLRDQPKVKEELVFLDSTLTTLLTQSKGDYLFGQFSIADAFYAPMCMRINTFALPTSPQLANYVETMLQTKGVKEWISDALIEEDFVVEDYHEPYRLVRTDHLRTK